MKQCEKCDYIGVDAPCARCGSTMMRLVSSEYGGTTGSTDYAYETIEEYEEIVGVKVNETFRIGWTMARTTNAILGMLSN